MNSSLLLKHWIFRSLLALLSGFLANMATPSSAEIVDWGWVAWFAFSPWLFAVARVSCKEGVYLGFIVGALYIIPGKWNTMLFSLQGSGFPDGFEPLGLAAIFLPLIVPFALIGGLIPLCQRWHVIDDASISPFFTSALLTLFILASFIIFPYTPVALIASQTALIQHADLGGVPLVCFTLLLSNTLIAQFFLQWQITRKAVNTLSVWFLLFVVLVTYGQYRLREYQTLELTDTGKSLSVLAIQTNISLNASRKTLLRDKLGGRYSAVELTRLGLSQTPACELIVWPETPVNQNNKSGTVDNFCQKARELAISFGRPFLVECAVKPTPQTLAFEAHLFDKEGTLTGTHRKSNLIPLYEGAVDLFGFTGYIPGKAISPITLETGQKLAPAICNDIHDPSFIRDGINQGGDFIIHMASFSPFGSKSSISALDIAMARLRAIEQRRPIIRASNRGHAGLILATGDIGSQGLSPAYTRSARCHQSFSPAIKSPYSRWGDIPTFTFLIFLVLFSFFWNRRQFRSSEMSK